MEGTSIARCPVMSAPGRVMPSTTFFNPRDPRFNDNPYQYYKRLREEDPVHKSALGAWFLSRYDDIRRTIKHSSVSVQDIPAQLRVKNQLLKTKKIAADQPDNLDALIDHAENWMAFLEGAKHARLRGLVSIAFERRAANAMRPFIRSAAIGLIEEAKQCGGMDLMKDFATVIPVRTMAETLGLPPESFPKLVAWINSIARIFDPLLSMKEYGELNQASREFIDFLQELIPSRRLERRADLISALIDAQDRGNQLSERELISVIIILFGAGMDTTATLIGNAGLAFFNNPDHTKQLRSNLDLMPSAVEELLRYDAPLQMTKRAMN